MPWFARLCECIPCFARKYFIHVYTYTYTRNGSNQHASSISNGDDVKDDANTFCISRVDDGIACLPKPQTSRFFMSLS